MRSPTLLLLALGVGLASGAAAQDPPASDPALAGAEDGRRVVLESLDGGQRREPLEGLSLRDPRERNAVFLRFEGLGDPRPPAGDPEGLAWVQLHGGDRLRAQVSGGDGEQLSLALADEVPMVVSLDQIGSLVYPARQPREGGLLTTPSAEGDRLYVRRGAGLDKLDGLLSKFSSEGVVFSGRFGERTYPWGEVAALYIERLETQGDVAAARVPVLLDLVGGGRLSGELLELTSDALRLQRGPGPDLRLPLNLIAELAMNDGSFRYLSELALVDGGPTDLFGGSDDLGMRYPAQMDRNFEGAPLRCGGREWSRGVGVHAPSRLTWRLEGAWKELRGWAGVDDSALDNELKGSVLFRVLVDGEQRWASPVVRGGDAPLALPALDLGGAQELVLEVDCASEAFFSDRANWLRPVLVRGDGKPR